VTSRAVAGAAGPSFERRPAGPSERRLWVAIGLAVAVVIGLAVGNGPANLILGLVVAALLLAAYQHVLLAWPTLLGLILAVILFVPIRRYTVGGNLPFELEPYRLLITVVLGCWLCAVAADPRVRVRASGLEAPIGALLLAMLLSLAVNIPRVNAAGAAVIKDFTFFLSYLLVVYFIVSVIRSRRDLDRMLGLLVGGGTIVALAALIEWRTKTNFFNWYSHVAPFLHYVDEGVAQARGTGVRARASAQHPIALSAALAMLVPLAIYLYQRQRRRIWLAAGTVLTLGALSTGSRTGTTMLIAVLVTFLCIKPRDTVRLLPMLVPLLVVIQVVMPGTIGTMRTLLNPNYVVKEQSYDQGATAGRVADLGPALDRWATKPLLGSGFGTTVADPNAPKESDSQILDDQWLGSLLQIGAVGALALLWLFVRAIRQAASDARSARGPDSWLGASLAAALVSFTVGMLTFDAFAFVQVTFFAFIMIGFAAVVARLAADEARQRPIAIP
jgi:O-antigen ligase/polysaccharide polymerase Wzy-like membrane protein